MQRYTVFLNDRIVSISQNIDIPENKPGEMILDFTDKSQLIKAYDSFYKDTNCTKLSIKTGENFAEACEIFNKLFIRIEAAGGIVNNQKEKYLFIKRLGIWDLPKGKLKKRESIEVGALREVTEETGLSNLTITRQLPSTFHIYTDRKGKEILKETYWFEMTCHMNQKLVPQTEEDITEVKWFSVKGLNIPLKNTYSSLRALLENYFNL